MFKLKSCLSCLLAIALSSFGLGQGFIHTDGTRLVDGTGKEIQLRGCNLGTWLFIEPWMWGMNISQYWGGDTEPDGLGQLLSSHLTQAQIDTIWQTYRTNFVTENDIALLQRYGFNSVRVPIDFRLLVDQFGNYRNEAFPYIDQLLVWCQAHGVYAILDMHSVPGSPYYWNSTNFMHSDHNKALYLAAWTNLAGRYANNTTVAGLDLVNEPVVGGDSALRDVQVAATQAIRSVDPNHVIYAEGDWYDSQLDILGTPWDSNMGFEDHNYWTNLPNNLPHDQNLATTYNIPIWMGEFGINSNDWIAKQVALLNNKVTLNGRTVNSSWDCWALKSNSIWSYEQFGAYGPAFNNLLTKVNANTAVTSAEVYDGMMDLANSVKYANSHFNLDALDAFSRPNFLSTAKAWTNRALPCTIKATEYDMGAEGVAYHDTLSDSTGGTGSGFQNWNNGWQYRNDGVDIASFVDGGLTKFAVGWIDAGEWINYTTLVTPGNYNLRVRASGYGGQMHAEINGANISGALNLPSAGSWDSYIETLFPGTRIIAGGRLPIRFVTDTSGYNLYSVAFDVLPPTVPLNMPLFLEADANGKYMELSGNNVKADENSPGDPAKGDQFVFQLISGNTVVIKSVKTGKYLHVGPSPSAVVTVDAPSASSASRFAYLDNGNGSFSLFNMQNLQYLSADKFMQDPPILFANRTIPQGWESFRATSAALSVRSFLNSK